MLVPAGVQGAQHHSPAEQGKEGITIVLSPTIGRGAGERTEVIVMNAAKS